MDSEERGRLWVTRRYTLRGGRGVALLGGDVALCCVLLFTHLPVMFSAPRAAHTDIHLTHLAASSEL